MAQEIEIEEGQEATEEGSRDEFGEALVVTARRVEENVQEVPGSVQAVPGDFLDDTDTTRLYELQWNVPGLVVTNVGMFGANLSLRGIGGLGRAVATYLDGAYLGNENLAITRMFDLERVEVLKGPQGTLYGRNSTGGSINFITRGPEDTFSASVEAGYGTFSSARAQGHLNLPLRNTPVRLAFVASNSDGYIRNSVDDRRFAENDYWGLRGSTRLFASESMFLDLAVQHVTDDGASGELWAPRPDFLVNPRDIQLTTVTLEDPYLTTESDTATLSLEYELGFGSFRSIAAWAGSDVRNVDDCAGIPLLRGCVRGVEPGTLDQWSLEAQLHLHGSGSIDGLVGAHYYDGSSERDNYQLVPLSAPLPSVDSHSTEGEKAAGIFGQTNVRLSDRTGFTSGLRLSGEETRVTTIGTGLQDSPTLLVDERSSDEVSWRLDLEHAIAADALLYAGVSTGYNSGGVITSLLVNGEPDRFDPEYLTAYEAGAKSQWLKRRLTLNAAAFYYDFEDMQVQTVRFDGSNQVAEVDNAARAELYGIDAEASFEIRERLTLSGGVVWMPKREFVEFVNDATGDTLSGNEMVRAPEWSATSAVSGEHLFGAIGTLGARIELNYRSGVFYTKENNPLIAQDDVTLLNLFLTLEHGSGRWYVFASGRNLTDEDYFHQVFLQSSPGYPDTYESGVGFRF